MNKYRFASALFVVINLTLQAWGCSSEPEPRNPYMLLAGHAQTLLQKCTKEQGTNVENDCFDIKDLFVTKEERNRKFLGWLDYQFPNPSKDPYQTLVENLIVHNIAAFLDLIQTLEDDDKFLEIGISTINDIPIRAYKKNLGERFSASRRQLIELSSCPFLERKRSAMAECLTILKEIVKFGQDGCQAHKVFVEQF
jgi:hypothetical protein